MYFFAGDLYWDRRRLTPNGEWCPIVFDDECARVHVSRAMKRALSNQRYQWWTSGDSRPYNTAVTTREPALTTAIQRDTFCLPLRIPCAISQWKNTHMRIAKGR